MAGLPWQRRRIERALDRPAAAVLALLVERPRLARRVLDAERAGRNRRRVIAVAEDMLRLRAEPELEPEPVVEPVVTEQVTEQPSPSAAEAVPEAGTVVEVSAAPAESG